MNKWINLSLIILFSVSLTGCSNNEVKDIYTTSSEPQKTVIKKKTEQSSSEIATQETFKDVEAKPNEIIQESSVQQISDMPPSWYGTQQEWEEAKAQGWTAEGYEEQVRASQNEAVYEVNDGRDEFNETFNNEHGRKPSSGETQLDWLKEQGFE